MIPFPDSRTNNRYHPVLAASVIAYCGWRGEGMATVEEVWDWFADTTNRANRILRKLIGESAHVWDFLRWCDSTPRQQMRRELLREIWRELRKRGCSLRELQELPATQPAGRYPEPSVN